MWSERTIQLIQAACEEDLGRLGDITSGLLDEPEVEVVARVVPRAAGVICGLALGPEICAVFTKRLGQVLTERHETQGAADFSPRGAAQAEACGSSRGSSPSALKFEAAKRGAGRYEDRQPIQAGESAATVRGPKAAVLAVERTLLNFLGRMSGVATLTRQYAEAARNANPDVQIFDTRKTVPGWRELDKYAVRTGGGTNHRLGLYDAILIKDNHLAGVPTERLASTLFDMLNRTAASPKSVEVEVDGLEQLAEVCKVVGVDAVLLDNFSLDELREAVAYRDSKGLRGKVALEASGKVTLETVADIAATGVDRISVGALTHSAPSLDIGLDF